MNLQLTNGPTKKYDLEERTAQFAEKVIDILRDIPKTPVNNPLIEQLMKSSGSIGANYCEATEAESKKDFIHKIGISKKEAKESQYWFRLLAKANPQKTQELEILQKEVHELLLIFSATIRTSKRGI